MKKALITGITGQDGSYLAEYLLGLGYEVHGLIRRSSNFNTQRLSSVYKDEHERTDLHLHYGDLLDAYSLRKVLDCADFEEVYNLAAQSHVRISFDQAEYTFNVITLGTQRLLDALRDQVRSSGKQIKFYQAGSSEMFGDSPPPQCETTSFRPRSPYGIAKLAAHWSCCNYREAYGLHISNGILFNHEGSRRGETFVTRKITRGLTRIYMGLQDTLYLGDLETKRDWGHAQDYVRAMHLMLQQENPDDYVIATGEMHSVREFLDEACKHIDLDWKDHVKFDDRYLRPTEVQALCGDSSKARTKLGWEPKVTFGKLVEGMIFTDLETAQNEFLVKMRTTFDLEKGTKIDPSKQ